jgi:anti-anti-sigma factor
MARFLLLYNLAVEQQVARNGKPVKEAFMEGTIDTHQITCDCDISLLKVRGSLDAHSCDQFKRCVTDCFDHNNYRLAVDMSEVNLMTCAGVGVLIGRVRWLRKIGAILF